MFKHTQELAMTNQYITPAYTELNDQRKIEVLVEQLTRIVMHNDIDTLAVMQVLNSVADLRKQVSDH